MADKLDSLLLEKADVFLRLGECFDEVLGRFWKELENNLNTLSEEILGDKFQISFADLHCDAGYILDKPWILEIDGVDPEEEWNRAPAFWFPGEGFESRDGFFRLVGLRDSPRVYAAIYGTPLTEYLQDLESVKQLWGQMIAAPLEQRAWEPFGKKVRTATSRWGSRIPIRLDHREIAKGMESDDLRPALAPLEKAIEDFAHVCPAMSELVEKVREMKQKSQSDGGNPT